MEHVSQLGPVSMITIIGMTISLILPSWISFGIIVVYVCYQFNIIQTLYCQIPEDIRYRYKSKILVVLKWLCAIMEDDSPTSDTHSIVTSNVVNTPKTVRIINKRN